MGTQKFCIRWNNRQTNMLNVFDQLLRSGEFVDVTLACEGLSIKAHKVVLSACSPYFQSLLRENPCKHPIVILKDMRYRELRTIINFMYKGEINVSQEQLTSLLKTAQTLKVKGLAEVSSGMFPSSQGDAALSVVEELVAPTAAQEDIRPPQTFQDGGRFPPCPKQKWHQPSRQFCSNTNVCVEAQALEVPYDSSVDGRCTREAISDAGSSGDPESLVIPKQEPMELLTEPAVELALDSDSHNNPMEMVSFLPDEIPYDSSVDGQSTQEAIFDAGSLGDPESLVTPEIGVIKQEPMESLMEPAVELMIDSCSLYHPMDIPLMSRNQSHDSQEGSSGFPSQKDGLISTSSRPSTSTAQIVGESPAEKKRRLNRERQQRWRARQNSGKTEAKRAADVQYHASRREQETLEQARARRASNAASHANRRSRETPEQTQARRLIDAISHANRRGREALEQTQIRRASDALSHAIRRKQETFEETQIRRASDALSHASRRREREMPEQTQTGRVYDAISHTNHER